MPNTLHLYSVIGNGQNSKLLPLKSFVQNMQLLVKTVSSTFSKDLNHEAKAKDSTLKANTANRAKSAIKLHPTNFGIASCWKWWHFSHNVEACLSDE